MQLKHMSWFDKSSWNNACPAAALALIKGGGRKDVYLLQPLTEWSVSNYISKALPLYNTNKCSVSLYYRQKKKKIWHDQVQKQTNSERSHKQSTNLFSFHSFPSLVLPCKPKVFSSLHRSSHGVSLKKKSIKILIVLFKGEMFLL